MTEIDFHGQGHGREWQCLLCVGKTFNRKAELLRHIFTEHGINPFFQNIIYEHPAVKKVYTCFADQEEEWTATKYGVLEVNKVAFHLCSCCGLAIYLPADITKCPECGEATGLDLSNIEQHIGYKLPVLVKEKYFLHK